ncbi:MAG: glycosyltransferase [Butyrivibrio sp.]|nr:glycosyltransferase [Butyrivibrio sp.]
MKPILSICIPTYNRKQRLLELLELIREYNVNKIPILVFDNASTDGTQKSLQSYVERGEIIYFRNEKNLGHDGNYLRMIEEGRKYAQYSLWLGDDDRITADFFIDIPKKLAEDMPELLVLNSQGYTNSFVRRNVKKVLKATKFLKMRFSLPNSYDIHYINEQAFFANFFDKLSFGVVVVNNDLLNVEKAKRYHGTYHLYSGAIWEMLDEQNDKNGKINVCVTAKPYIIWGKGSKSYARDMENVCRGIGLWMSLLPTGLQSEVYCVTKDMAAGKAYGADTKYIWEEYVKNLKENNEAIYNKNFT